MLVSVSDLDPPGSIFFGYADPDAADPLQKFFGSTYVLITEK